MTTCKLPKRRIVCGRDRRAASEHLARRERELESKKCTGGCCELSGGAFAILGLVLAVLRDEKCEFVTVVL